MKPKKNRDIIERSLKYHDTWRIENKNLEISFHPMMAEKREIKNFVN